MSGLEAVLISIIPSIGVALIFWYVMRGIIRADRREREELARIDAEDAARDAQLAPKNDDEESHATK